MADIGDLARNDKVLIRKGIESVSQYDEYIKKFPEDKIGTIYQIFEDEGLVGVSVTHDQVSHSLMYRPSTLIKIPKTL